jgi:hypothetical protein
MMVKSTVKSFLMSKKKMKVKPLKKRSPQNKMKRMTLKLLVMMSP